jgi:hypothetical protein
MRYSVLSRVSVAFVVASMAAAGCHRNRAGGGPSMPVIHRVVVGPDPSQVNPERLEVWKAVDDKPSEEVVWILVDKNNQLDTSRNLVIEFEKADAFPQNRPNPATHRYRMFCSGAYCQSGPADSKASGEYVYYQIATAADGKEVAADGRIIIRP